MLNTAHATPYLASVSFPPTLPYTCVLRLHTVATPRTTRRPNELDNVISSQSGHLVACLLFFITTFDFYQLIVSIPSHTARPWFRACGLRGRVWARPAGRRRRTTVHAPTAFIMERTQSPVSSSWDTSDSTEPKPRLQSTISTATTPLSMWLFKRCCCGNSQRKTGCW